MIISMAFLPSRHRGNGFYKMLGGLALLAFLPLNAFAQSASTSSAPQLKPEASVTGLFTMHYHDGRRVLKSDNRTAALRSADLGKIRITTVGGHFIGAYKTGGGKTDVLLWGAGQFGNWGNLDHRAGAIAIEVGYQPGGKIAEKIKPWIRGGYFRSTGDGDPTDGVHETFFQTSLAQPYARFPFFNLMNNG